MKKLKSKISISTVTGNMRDSWVNIELTDELSRQVICNIAMNYSDFAKTVLQHNEVPCEVELYGTKNLGQKRETKIETVPAFDRRASLAEIKKHLAPYETDGWQAEPEQARLADRINDKIAIILERFVKP